MPPGLRQRAFQFLHFLLLPDALRFRCVQLVQFLLAVAVSRLLFLLLFLANASHGGKGVLVAEAARHLVHFVPGFLGVCFGQFRVDAVGGHGLFRLSAAPKSLHHEIHQGAQRYEDDRREDVLGLFEIDFNHVLRCY